MFFLIFSTFVWNVSHSNKNWPRYHQNGISVCMYSNRYPCQIFMKLYFLDRFSKSFQISNSKKILPVGADFPCGETDRHNEANIRLSQYYKGT